MARTYATNLGTEHDDISPQHVGDGISSPPQMRRGCCGRRPWRGWWAARGIQPPRAGRCQRCPSLSKEGTFLKASFTYVALHRNRAAVKNFWWQCNKPWVSDRPPFSKGGLQGGK